MERATVSVMCWAVVGFVGVLEGMLVENAINDILCMDGKHDLESHVCVQCVRPLLSTLYCMQMSHSTGMTTKQGLNVEHSYDTINRVGFRCNSWQHKNQNSVSSSVCANSANIEREERESNSDAYAVIRGLQRNATLTHQRIVQQEWH